MKKILIMASVIALGVVSNAATIKWSVNAVQSSPDNAVEAGWVVQIYTASTAYDYAKAVSGDITATFSGATVAAGSSFRAANNETDGLANGTSESYFMVIYDNSNIANADNYIISDVVSVTASDAGADVTLGFGSMLATTTANKFLNSSWTATAAVPEPTSGILLLLGVAGLALRRKQK